MFGDPLRNTTDGVQTLLALAHGTTLPKLTMPVGQQVPGRVDFGRSDQLAAVERDKAALDNPEMARAIEVKYGLSVAAAKERIEHYYHSAGLPPGAIQRDDAPKLDPKKETPAAHE